MAIDVTKLTFNQQLWAVLPVQYEVVSSPMLVSVPILQEYAQFSVWPVKAKEVRVNLQKTPEPSTSVSVEGAPDPDIDRDRSFGMPAPNFTSLGVDVLFFTEGEARDHARIKNKALLANLDKVLADLHQLRTALKDSIEWGIPETAPAEPKTKPKRR